MGKRFAAHFGSLDNISQLASMGFTEVGLVFQWDGASVGTAAAAAIHNAGIKVATFNLFNDGSSPPSQIGAAGSSYAGYFQAIASAGWDAIAGEGCGGSVIGTVMNYLPYVNYGGIVGDSQGDMYASPWNHPTSGGRGHSDYIETYNNSNQYRDPSAALGWSRSAGASHLGILIMYGPNPAADASTYINVVDSNGCDTILFWGGYSGSSSACVGLAQQLISHYGVTKDGSGAAAGGGGGGGAAAAPSIQYAPIINCPCKYIWFTFAGGKVGSVDQKLEFKQKVVGYAGYVDNREYVIPGKPYTGKMELWCKNPAGISWLMTDFWPDNKGNFAFYIGSDAAEARQYSVCFV
jgi:hypothetical protein